MLVSLTLCGTSTGTGRARAICSCCCCCSNAHRRRSSCCVMCWCVTLLRTLDTSRVEFHHVVTDDLKCTLLHMYCHAGSGCVGMHQSSCCSRGLARSSGCLNLVCVCARARAHAHRHFLDSRVFDASQRAISGSTVESVRTCLTMNMHL